MPSKRSRAVQPGRFDPPPPSRRRHDVRGGRRSQLGPPQAPYGPQTWPEIINSWLHDPDIRRTLFAAFVVTAVALVLIAKLGGSFALIGVLFLVGMYGFAVQHGRHT
ncbi:MAG TPA: hypothetical protein VNP92_19315 [Actinophytocola sp.]|nr:hypothetical protein [Actinophytocola sp.]